AWVEVHDGSHWHRIDLGGAAGEMNLTSELDVPHEVPADPYTWPPRSEPGERMVARSLTRAGAADSTAGDRASSTEQTVLPTSASPADTLAPPSASDEPVPPADADGLNETVLSLNFSGATLRRGERFGLH